MRDCVSAIMLVLAFIATCISLFATSEAKWVWEQIQILWAVNLLIVAPLWFTVVFLRVRSRRRAVLAGLAVSVGVAMGLSLMQAGLYHAASVMHVSCGSRIKYIGLALHQYHERYGRFPPACLLDSNGRPMHSWRALLLPFLDTDVSKQYSLDEPWNGPNNRKLIGTIAKVYRCPKDSKECGDTSYVAVVGPRTAWPGTQSTKISDIRDGTSKTILIIEVADSGIGWTEPRDLSFDDMDFHVNGNPHASISSSHSKWASVVMADASARALPDNLPPEIVRALLTTAGGENCPDDVPE